MKRFLAILIFLFFCNTPDVMSGGNRRDFAVIYNGNVYIIASVDGVAEFIRRLLAEGNKASALGVFNAWMELNPNCPLDSSILT